MGRKIRTGALLMLVLAMIYTQQAVIYAQNEAEKFLSRIFPRVLLSTRSLVVLAWNLLM